MKKVYLNDTICQSALSRLREHVEIVSSYEHPEELDAIIVRQAYCPGDVIVRASKCRLIQMHGVGLDRIDLDAAKKCGIPVRNVPDQSTESVAELALALIMACARKLKFIDTGLSRGAFDRFGLPALTGTEIAHKTLGIAGGGRIGQKLASIMMNAFDCRVLCWSPHVSYETCRALGFEKVETLRELVAQSDFVSIHSPLSEKTYHMFGGDVFSHANPDLILVSTARGGIVDEKALYEALREGKIRAAALDVFEHQPPEKENPLLGCGNFVGTLHVGGSTEEAMERVGNAVVDNVFEALEITEAAVNH